MPFGDIFFFLAKISPKVKHPPPSMAAMRAESADRPLLTRSSSHLRADAHTLLHQLMGGAISAAPVPSSLMRSDLRLLFQDMDSYFVAPKHDGERLFLLFGCHEKTGQDYIVAVRRNGEVLRVHGIQAPDNFFYGTLLDGEYIEASNRWYMFDVFAIQGYEHRQYSYSQRLAAVTSTVAKITSSMCTIIPKVFYKATSQSMRNAAASEGDGIVLVDGRQPVTLGRMATCYKVKDTRDNTIDLEVRSSAGGAAPPTNQLWSSDGPVTALKAPGDVNELVPGVYEFRLEHDASKKEWKAVMIRPRPDKSRANSTFVIGRTRMNVSEGLTPTELARLWDQQCEYNRRANARTSRAHG